MSSLGNPRKWRYTWEALAHIPTLRLFLFTHQIKPLNQCNYLKVTLNFEELVILVSWTEEIQNQNVDFSLRVPLPRVLVDVGSPPDFKAMEDHIEVKLVLLLPVDHPLFMNFDSFLNISDKEPNRRPSSFNSPQSLSVDSDLKWLSSQAGVNLFCKKCSTKLTKKPLRSFVEMPSADWREVADNWFGACCCSFGGISEKLVKHYDNSYLFAKGTCLIDPSSIVVANDDLAEHVFPDCFVQSQENDCVFGPVGEDTITESVIASGSNGKQRLFSENQCEVTSVNDRSRVLSQMFDSTSAADENLSCISFKKERLTSNLESGRENNVDISPCISSAMSDLSVNMAHAVKLSAATSNHCCADKTTNVLNHYNEGCSHDIFVTSKDEEATECFNPLKNHKSLLNISLGNGFMVRNSNLSKDVDWIELSCLQCSSLLGAYPSASNVRAPADGGVRLFKCYTSTGLPIGMSDDIFRDYTLHRMFINQLMESAHDELSFRTVVRDLRTRAPMLQIVLLNSDAWSCSGYCLEMEEIVRPVPKIDLHPVVKVLFSDCSNTTEAQSRMLEEWATKNEADEVFMLQHQVKDLIESLKSAMSLPLSCSTMQGLSLSSIER